MKKTNRTRSTFTQIAHLINTHPDSKDLVNGKYIFKRLEIGGFVFNMYYPTKTLKNSFINVCLDKDNYDKSRIYQVTWSTRLQKETVKAGFDSYDTSLIDRIINAGVLSEHLEKVIRVKPEQDDEPVRRAKI